MKIRPLGAELHHVCPSTRKDRHDKANSRLSYSRQSSSQQPN